MLHIKVPFYTAGRIYGWPGKPIGLGIRLNLLEAEDKLSVKVGNSPEIWEIDKKIAQDFIGKYKSIHNTKGTRIGVIAWSMFTKKEENKLKQQKLL